MSINGNFRLGLSFCAFYVAIGFALAGVTFPVMAMPPVIKAYTATMPLNYWVQVMLDQSMRGIPYIYDLKAHMRRIGYSEDEIETAYDMWINYYPTENYYLVNYV